MFARFVCRQSSGGGVLVRWCNDVCPAVDEIHHVKCWQQSWFYGESAFDPIIGYNVITCCSQGTNRFTTEIIPMSRTVWTIIQSWNTEPNHTSAHTERLVPPHAVLVDLRTTVSLPVERMGRWCVRSVWGVMYTLLWWKPRIVWRPTLQSIWIYNLSSLWWHTELKCCRYTRAQSKNI